MEKVVLGQSVLYNALDSEKRDLKADVCSAKVVGFDKSGNVNVYVFSNVGTDLIKEGVNVGVKAGEISTTSMQ